MSDENNNNNISLTFSDVGFNSIENGVVIFQALGITETTLKDPIQWQKIKEIALFTNAFQDGASLIRSILMKKGNRDIDPLDYAHNYIQKRVQIMETEQDLAQLKREASLFE